MNGPDKDPTDETTRALGPPYMDVRPDDRGYVRCGGTDVASLVAQRLPVVVALQLGRPGRREAAGSRYSLFLAAAGGVGRIFPQGSFFPASGIIFLISDW